MERKRAVFCYQFRNITKHENRTHRPTDRRTNKHAEKDEKANVKRIELNSHLTCDIEFKVVCMHIGLQYKYYYRIWYMDIDNHVNVNECF